MSQSNNSVIGLTHLSHLSGIPKCRPVGVGPLDPSARTRHVCAARPGPTGKAIYQAIYSITFTNDTTHFTPHINPSGEQRRLQTSTYRQLEHCINSSIVINLIKVLHSDRAEGSTGT